MCDKPLDFAKAVELAKEFLMLVDYSFIQEDLRTFYKSRGYAMYRQQHDRGVKSIDAVRFTQVMRNLCNAGLIEKISQKYWRKIGGG